MLTANCQRRPRCRCLRRCSQQARHPPAPQWGPPGSAIGGLGRHWPATHTARFAPCSWCLPLPLRARTEKAVGLRLPFKKHPMTDDQSSRGKVSLSQSNTHSFHFHFHFFCLGLLLHLLCFQAHHVPVFDLLKQTRSLQLAPSSPRLPIQTSSFLIPACG